MNVISRLATVWGTLLIAAACASAQIPMAGQPGLNAALLKLFGEFTAFSAKADVRLLDQARKETLSLTMDFALLDRMMRADLNMSQIKSQEVPEKMVAQLKQFGMDQMTSVVWLDKKTTLVIYPILKAYTEVPLPPEEVVDSTKKVNLTKTKLGKETVAGHPCEKTKVLVTGEKGERHEATVWYASDLKGFPVQMQMNQQETTLLITYRDVRLAKPDAKLFAAPANFTKYQGMQEMMQAVMMKALGEK